MLFKKTLCALTAAAAFGLAGCTGDPEIKELKDLTGDDVPDVVVRIRNKGTYLFIGQKDGNFLRAEQRGEDLKYFKTENGDRYVRDGESYKLVKD